ncbi:hypothetical protein [Parablautia intestinalis]|nr:hypothetical protein [Parablautia intestinalis]
MIKTKQMIAGRQSVREAVPVTKVGTVRRSVCRLWIISKNTGRKD